ncbi:hypothetical protein ACVFDQ_002752 [Enterobacter hormaechei]
MTTSTEHAERLAERESALLTAQLAYVIHEGDESKLRPEHIQILNRTRILRSVLRRWR